MPYHVLYLLNKALLKCNLSKKNKGNILAEATKTLTYKEPCKKVDKANKVNLNLARLRSCWAEASNKKMDNYMNFGKIFPRILEQLISVNGCQFSPEIY